MKLTITLTDRVAPYAGHACRVWEGITDTGAKVKVLVAGLVAHDALSAGRLISALGEQSSATVVLIDDGEVQRLRDLVDSLTRRVESQSQALTKVAERNPSRRVKA